MKARNKRLIVIGVIVVLAAGGAWLAVGKRPAPQPAPAAPSGSGRAAVEGLPSPADLVGMLTGVGGAGPASAPPGWSQEQLGMVEAALKSEDVEGALIALLSNPNAPHNLVVWYLGEVGGEKAAEALCTLTTTGPAELRVPAEANLFLVRINSLSAGEQVERISAELDSLHAGAQDLSYKGAYGNRLIQRLGGLGLPEGIDVLHRLIAADLSLKKGEKGHWVDYGIFVRALGDIGDPRGVSFIEPIFHHFFNLGGDWMWASETWWKLKLKATPREQWPDLLHDTLASLLPQAACNYAAGAKIIGPGCLPRVREILLDRSLREISRIRAIEVLAELHDPQAADIIYRIVADPSEQIKVRSIGVGFVGEAGSAEGLERILAVARQAIEEGSDELLLGSLQYAESYARRGASLGSGDEAFLRDLAANHRTRSIRSWAAAALYEFGLGPPPEGQDVPGAPG